MPPAQDKLISFQLCGRIELNTYSNYFFFLISVNSFSKKTPLLSREACSATDNSLTPFSQIYEEKHDDYTALCLKLLNNKVVKTATRVLEV